MNNEDGFDFYSLKAKSGDTKSLIVILHGHNSHPSKYIKWAKKTQDENPDADVILIRAPIATQASEEEKERHNLKDADDLYTWFNLEKKTSQQAGLLVKHAFNRVAVVSRLNKFIDKQLEKRELEDENLALMGFSLGGGVALQTALRRKEKVAAVVCHSGAVLPFTKARKKPDTLVIMGDQDELFYAEKKKLPKKASGLLKMFHKAGMKLNLHHDKSVKRLQKAGVPVEEKIFEGQPHRITEESWNEATKFVASRLKPKK